VIANQIALSSALADLEKRSGLSLIIDGHAVLETVDGPVETSFSEYQELPISMIVNIRDDAEVVAIRRIEKGKDNSAEDVSLLQDAEEDSSLLICAES
jgi:adenylate kinase